MKSIVFVCLTVMWTINIFGSSHPKADTIRKGIAFVEGSTWHRLLEKARDEKKYIFVDCFTTWCGPCKQMDKEVYQTEKVGMLANSKFIAIKLQMDTGRSDDLSTRLLYADAMDFRTRFRIHAFPTLLFFNPEGKLLNKRIGFESEDAFISLLLETLDSSRDYYHLLAKYNQGLTNLQEMGYLAKTAVGIFGDTALAQKISRSYISSVLNSQGWMTKERIEFIREFTKTSKDKGFTLFYNYTDTINSLMGNDNFAQDLLTSIIYKEYIQPAVLKCDTIGGEPGWDELSKIIENKFNSYYADRVILGSLVTWTRERKNMTEFINYYYQFICKYFSLSLKKQYSSDPLESLLWNNRAWQIFSYSNDINQLLEALKWSTRAITESPMGIYLDTYANILYKLGYSSMALSWEEWALKADSTNPSIQLSLQKMRANLPTW